MVFSAMLTDVLQDSDHGVHIKDITDGKLFNQHRLQALSKVKETVLKGFLYAEIALLMPRFEPEM